MHFYGPEDRYPLAPTCPFPPPCGLVTDYRELQAQLGLERYEMSRVGPPHYDDVGRLAKRLVETAPERMLWASNWPHPSAQDDRPDDVVLLDLLLDWVSDEATRRRILVDNPAELYGF